MVTIMNMILIRRDPSQPPLIKGRRPKIMLQRIKFKIKAFRSRLKSKPNTKFVHLLNLRIRENLAAKYGVVKYSLSPVFKFSAAVSMAVIAAFTGIGVYAQGNPAVNETHPLYPIKRSIENMREIVALTPKKQAEVKMDKAEERLRETERLSEKNIVAKQALKDANDDVREAIKLSRKIVKDEDSERVVRKIDKLDAKRAEKIEKMLAKKNGKMKEAVTEIMEDEDFADNQLIEESTGRDLEMLEKGVGRRVRLMNKLSEDDSGLTD